MKHLPAALSLAAVLCLTAPAFAQTPQFTDPANLAGERVSPRDGRELPIDQGASGLAQLLRKLNTRASLMNIVAHPDDEDGGMLTLYSRGLGARVADLSLTRGEGGQNAMTADFEDALGLLRTQELLSCDRFSRTDQFFGTEVDFGFSKTKEEAFAKWTHDRVLYDVVRAIRIYRPLVLTSTWIGGVTDGHGQHQVSGQIAQEAFLAAGDPKVFPELTAEGILPWQPLRVYARVPMQSISERGLYDYATNQYTPARFTNYVTGIVTTTPPTADVLVHEGTPDPLLSPASAGIPSTTSNRQPTTPLTYIQFARLGLGQQKSQIGPGFRAAPTGTFDVAYHLYGDRTTTGQADTAAGPQAPTARHITAQPEGLGNANTAAQRAVSPTQAPAALSADPNFFTGIDTSIQAIASLAPSAPPVLQMYLADADEEITAATQHFKPAFPETVAPFLNQALHAVIMDMRLIGSLTFDTAEKANVLHELMVKKVQLNDALTLALGLNLEATANTVNSVAGYPIDIATQISHSEITIPEVREWTTNSVQQLSAEETVNDDKGILTDVRQAHHTLHISSPVTDTITRPYFKRDSIELPVYQIADPLLRLAAQTPSALTVWANVSFGTETVLIGRVVHAGSQPLSIVPPLSVALSTHAQVLPSNQHAFFIKLSVIPPNTTISDVKLHTPPTWKALPTATAANCGGCYPFEVEVPLGSRKPTPIDASAKLNGHIYPESYRPVGYPGLPTTNFYTPAETRIVPINLTLPSKKRIAYLPGTGDSVPEALTAIGLTPTLLTVADLTPIKLSTYDTVILGVRTYAAHPDLHGAPTEALLDYAKAGGNVIVQYQTAEFTAADAPYPLALGSNEKVVDETAPVRFFLPSTDLHSGANGYPEASASGLIAEKKKGALAPEGHSSEFAERLLVVPNKITPADFSGWVAERGHGFLSTWDPHYTAPTETHDPGQDPQRGGLITTPLGSDPAHQGRWTYVAFALYRQLPEAVPGAFRLFINLLNP